MQFIISDCKPEVPLDHLLALPQCNECRYTAGKRTEVVCNKQEQAECVMGALVYAINTLVFTFGTELPAVLMMFGQIGARRLRELLVFSGERLPRASSSLGFAEFLVQFF